MGVCGYNLLWVLLVVKWVKIQLQKILKWYTNRKKMKAVWFGHGLCFGLINSRLGGSSFSTSYGVCVFGAVWISKVDPRSKGSAVIKWVGSKLLNANHNLYGFLADFENVVHALVVFVISQMVRLVIGNNWKMLSTGPFTFIILELRTIPSKGGGYDAYPFTAFSHNELPLRVLHLRARKEAFMEMITFGVLFLVWVMAWIQAHLGFDPITHSGHSRKCRCYLGQLDPYYDWWIAWTPKRWIVSTQYSFQDLLNNAAHTIKACDASSKYQTRFQVSEP